MTWLIISLIAVAVLFVVLGLGNKTWRLRPRQLLCLFGLLIMTLGCFTTVPTGHTGILTTFGRVEDRTLEAGVNFKSPFQEVVVMDNRTQVIRVELSSFSSDIQEVIVDYSMNYQIDKKNAQTIYKTIGTDYYDTVMEPRIQEVVKSVIAKYTAESLIDRRDAMSVEITKTLVDQLGKYNIEVISTSIENIDFSDSFTDAVEAKVVAEQARLRAAIEQAQKTMEQEEQAKRAEIAAKADASVAKINAEAALEVKKTEADAEAYAGQKEAEKNQAISASLTDALIEYYTIAGWDGKLPAYYVTGVNGVLPILGALEQSEEEPTDTTEDEEEGKN